MRARPQNPRYLGHRDAGVELGDQIEVVVGKRQRPGLPNLEGNSSLGVKADPGTCFPHRRLRRIDTSYSRRRELSGEKQHRFAIAAIDHQGPLGYRHVQNRGGKRSQQWGTHPPMIASAKRETVWPIV